MSAVKANMPDKPNKTRVQHNTLYLPTEVRARIEKISVEVGFRREKRLSASRFVQYLISQYTDEAISALLNEDSHY